MVPSLIAVSNAFSETSDPANTWFFDKIVPTFDGVVSTRSKELLLGCDAFFPLYPFLKTCVTALLLLGPSKWMKPFDIIAS